MIVVSKGLVPGDVVVVDGVDKLREGSTVELVSRTATGAPASGPDKPGNRSTAARATMRKGTSSSKRSPGGKRNPRQG